MYLMIDNYDSFVYNLYAYLRELSQEVLVIRNDKITIEEIEEMENLSGILISPGPGRPSDGGISGRAVRAFAGRIPILGVCLGHQIIAHEYGAEVRKGTRPMHGKVTEIENNGAGLFSGLPARYRVTRYHSLVVSEENFPAQLQVNARSENGVIMALSHRTEPVYGVQFHPEAVLTEYGHELLQNFVRICKAWEGGKR